ncbi:hypothetical protein DIPPA_56587 [Diplonema papillatum]|nr:hypothetical protein DIPPA_56587 [Diplonema papillatum]
MSEVGVPLIEVPQYVVAVAAAVALAEAQKAQAAAQKAQQVAEKRAAELALRLEQVERGAQRGLSTQAAEVAAHRQGLEAASAHAGEVAAATGEIRQEMQAMRLEMQQVKQQQQMEISLIVKSFVSEPIAIQTKSTYTVKKLKNDICNELKIKYFFTVIRLDGHSLAPDTVLSDLDIGDLSEITIHPHPVFDLTLELKKEFPYLRVKLNDLLKRNITRKTKAYRFLAYLVKRRHKYSKILYLLMRSIRKPS